MGERKCEGNERQVCSYWLWSSPGIFSTILLFANAIVFQVLISLLNKYLYLLVITCDPKHSTSKMQPQPNVLNSN